MIRSIINVHGKDQERQMYVSLLIYHIQCTKGRIFPFESQVLYILFALNAINSLSY